MNETKSPLQSRTLWGAVAMLVSYLLNHAGVTVESAEINATFAQAAQAAELVLQVIGFVLVVWGRWKATKKIAA